MNILVTFRKDINDFLKQWGMSKTALGQEALNNPHIVFNILENGETTKICSMQRLYDFMDKYAKERKRK